MTQQQEHQQKKIHTRLCGYALTKTYSQNQGLFDVSFSISSHECLGVMGANGAGKSTLFKLIIGSLKPESGLLTFEQKHLNSLPLWKRVRLGIGYIGQQPALFPSLSLRDHLIMTANLMQTNHTQKKTQFLSDSIQYWVERFHLLSFQDQNVSTLSGGEQRKVEFARLCIQNPKLVILDEPFAALDEETIHSLKALLMQLKSQGTSLMITDHQKHHVEDLCDRQIFLEKGRIKSL